MGLHAVGCCNLGKIVAVALRQAGRINEGGQALFSPFAAHDFHHVENNRAGLVPAVQMLVVDSFFAVEFDTVQNSPQVVAGNHKTFGKVQMFQQRGFSRAGWARQNIKLPHGQRQSGHVLFLDALL